MRFRGERLASSQVARIAAGASNKILRERRSWPAIQREWSRHVGGRLLHHAAERIDGAPAALSKVVEAKCALSLLVLQAGMSGAKLIRAALCAMCVNVESRR